MNEANQLKEKLTDLITRLPGDEVYETLLHYEKLKTEDELARNNMRQLVRLLTRDFDAPAYVVFLAIFSIVDNKAYDILMKKEEFVSRVHEFFGDNETQGFGVIT